MVSKKHELKRSFIGALFLCFLFSQTNAQHFDWAKSVGGLGLDVGRAVTTDAHGNVILVGSFTGSAMVGSTTLTGYGSIDAFVAKFTADGDFLWARVISGPEEDLGRGVVTDNTGSIYVVGHFTDTVVFSATPGNVIGAGSDGGQDIFVAKYSAEGDFQWFVQAGGSEDDTATDIDWYQWSGKLYVSGGFQGRSKFGTTSLLSSGLTDAFLMKLDAEGNVHWVKSGGGDEHDVAASVAVGSGESIYIAGDFYDQATFQGTTLQAMGSSDMFLVKFSENGTMEWAKTNGGTTVDVATSVGTDVNGNVFVSGYYQGTTFFQNFSASAISYNDVFVSKFDAHGNCQWLSSAGSWGLDNCLGMAVAWDGATYLTGFFEEEMFSQNVSFEGDGYDIFVLNYNPDGTIRYGRNAGAGSSDFGTATCLGPDQSLYITGYYFFFADFDQNTIGNADNGDCFLARMTDILSVPEIGGQESGQDCLSYDYELRTIQIDCQNLSGWSVLNTLGQLVTSGTQKIDSKINLSHLEAGHYIFRADLNGTPVSTKFIVP